MMNKLNIGLVIGMTLILFSCGDFWKVPTDDEQKTNFITDIRQGPQRELIIDSESLVTEIALGHLEPLNIIEVHLQGSRFAPQFSSTIDRVYQSSWTKRYCVSDTCRRCPRLNFIECFEQEIKGQCVHRYRDQSEVKMTPLIFDKSPMEISAKIRIGKNIYPLGPLADNQGNMVITRFQLTKEILTETDEVFLVVVPEPNQGNVQTGFLGFTTCEGQGQSSFTSGGPTASAQVPNQERIEYKASVIIEYPTR
jgi:hypothetical protein